MFAIAVLTNEQETSSNLKTSRYSQSLFTTQHESSHKPLENHLLKNC